MLRKNATYETKYRVKQIVHKTTRKDIISRTLQAALIVSLDFRNLKSTTNKNNKFFKIFNQHLFGSYTYMYIVLRVPYTYNFIAIDNIQISKQGC